MLKSEQGFIQFDHKDPEVNADRLKMLHSIYKIESNRVAGPNAGNIPFWCWSEEWMANELGISDATRRRGLNALIQGLVSSGHMMKIPKRLSGTTLHTERESLDGDEDRYITRIAEMVRTIGSIHHFKDIEGMAVERSISTENEQENSSVAKFHPQLIEGVKWIPDLVHSASREIGMAQAMEQLRGRVSQSGLEKLKSRTEWEQNVTVENALDIVHFVLQAIEMNFKNELFLSQFQVDAVASSLLQGWKDESHQSSLMITSGTGTGKTLGFVLPALIDSVIDNFARQKNRDNTQKRMSQLLLYPRVDLAIDQEQNLRQIVKCMSKLAEEQQEDSIGNYAELIPTFRIDAGSKIKEPNQNVYDAAARHYAGHNGEASQILVAGIDSFKNRMFNPHVVASLRQNLHRVVLDEIHLSEGLTGAHHSAMLNRLRNISQADTAGRFVQFIGCSATIARPRRHAARLWFGNESKQPQVELIQAIDDDSKGRPTLIRNHILATNRRSLDRIGSLYDMTTLVGHQRRHHSFSVKRGKNPNPPVKTWQKTIGFADSLNIVGRWQEQMTINETTRKLDEIKPDSKEQVALPYAHWFSEPLSKIHEDGKKICAECRSCTKSSTIELSRNMLKKIKIKESSRSEENAQFAMEALDVVLPDDGSETITVSSLDGCPFLQAGTCWHFAPKSDAKEDRPQGKTKAFRDVLRVRQHTANTRSGGNSNQETGSYDGANALFKAKPYEAYGESAGKDVLYDVVVATPTLEVGIDMDNVTDVLTHKAIRNIASYRQKVGRAGRKEFTDVSTSTLISRRPGDFQHYRSPYRLITKKMVEPVPLATSNRAVKRNHAYMAIQEWLALQRHFIDRLNLRQKGTWEARLRAAVNHLEKSDNKDYLFRYLAAFGIGEDMASEALKVFLSHLNLFLKKVKIETKEEPFTVAALVLDYSGTSGKYPDINDAEGPQADSSAKTTRRLRQCVKNADTGRTSIVEDSPDVNLSSCIQASEAVQEFVDGKGINKNEVVNILGAALQEVKNISPEVKEDFDMEVDAITRALQKAKELIEDMGEAYQAPDHLQLAREIVKLRKRIQTSYLQDLLRNCPILQREPDYSMTGAFHINPHESKVLVKQTGKFRTETGDWQDREILETEAISVAMRDYLPGGWTYRNQGIAKHVVSGEVAAHSFHIDLAEKENTLDGLPMPVAKRTSTKSSAWLESKIPVWARGNILKNKEIELLQLKEVYIQKNKGPQDGNRTDHAKIGLAPDANLAIGMDFKGESAHALRRSMIPNCYPIHWTLCATEHANEKDFGAEVTQFIPDLTKSERTPGARQHPLAAHLFDSIKFCEGLDIQHLVSGLERGPTLERLSYKFNKKWAMFVDQYTTQSLVFHLSENIKQAIAQHASELLQQPFETAHLEAWGLYLDEIGALIHEDKTVDVFTRQDFIDAQLHAVKKLLGQMPATFGEFLETLNNQDLDMRSSIDLKIESKDDGRGGDSLNALYNMHAGDEYNIDHDWFKEKWVKRAFMNTLGGLLVEEGTTYAGVDQQKLGYTFDDTNDVIYLFDADAEGNGTVEMIKEFMHIPEAARAAQHVFNGEQLPTEDFFTGLERKLTLCSEHIIHTHALNENLDEQLIPNDWREEGKRLASSQKGVWRELEVESARLASLEARMIEFGSRHDEPPGSRDKKRQALDLCSYGCPICESTTNIVPYHAKRALTSRGLLDVIVSLKDANHFVLVSDNADELASMESRLGKSDDDISYRYTHEDDSKGAYNEVHVAVPTQIGIIGDRSSNGQDWGFLTRLAEEVRGVDNA